MSGTMANSTRSTKDTIEYLRACQAEGFGFGEALAILDGVALEDPNMLRKMRIYGHRPFYGTELIKIPHLCDTIEVPREHAAALSRGMLLWTIRPAITPDIDAVVEIGAGMGDLIVSLAVENLATKIEFIGTDIDPDNVEGISVLAEIARTNVATALLDIRNPDLAFLSNYKKVAIIAHSLFNVLDEKTVREFFDLVAELPNLQTFCVFDILGSHLTKFFPTESPFETSSGYGENAALANAIIHVQGRMKVTRAFPNLTGKRPLYPHSYFQLEPIRARPAGG